MLSNPNNTNVHEHYMHLALMHAKKSLGNTRVNPSVGCVIVKNNSVVSAGTTSFNGRPHAESNAILSLNKNIKNLDLYVTLEPCSHYGKTPPCTKLISRKKINKVFIAIKDPDIRSYNRAAKKLITKGIKVKYGLFQNEIKNFYRSYIIYKKEFLPFVTCKLAISKDFYIVNRKERWITNHQSRARGHILRSFHDCIFTSSKTINNDNPILNCRIDGLKKTSPVRIILDSDLKINMNSKIIAGAHLYKTIIFYNKYKKKKINKLNMMKVKTYKISNGHDGRINLEEALIKAKKLGFSRIFLESGINLVRSFFNKNLINEFKIFVSKNNLGKKGSINVKKDLHNFLKNKKKIKEVVNLNGDSLLSYNIK